MKLFHRKYGSGYPVLILHGLFGSSDNWITIGKRLSANYTVYLLDQRNHGKSPHHPVMTYEIMSEDVYELLTDHNLKQIHLIGHSMGGKTAMYFSAEYPHRVKSMVVLDISPKDYPVSHDKIINSLKVLNPEEITSRKEADSRLARTIDRKDLRQFLLKNLQVHQEGHFSWRINLPVIMAHIKALSSNPMPHKKYTGPVLFMRGENSDYILPEDSAHIKHYFPESKIRTIAGTSHWLHAEKPDAVYTAISAFLEKVDSNE
jgi:esterase